MPDDTVADPSPASSSHPGFRVVLTVGGVMTLLLACGIGCGLGAGGWVDYALFLLWALGTAAGIWWSIRKRRSPISGAVVGGTAGVIVFICYAFSGFVIAAVHLAFFTRSIDPLLHPPTENAMGQAAMLLMGIVTSLFVGAAGEGLAVRTDKARLASSAPLHDAGAPPIEFVTRILEPTGGKIACPRDWYYDKGHRGPVLMWTLSREDSRGGKRYTTGVRIQVFPRVLEGTGKTAEQFINDFAAQKRGQADKLVREWTPEKQGLLTRCGLEIEECDDRVRYSLFWGNNGLDLAIVMIAGTRKALWADYCSVFNRMSEFEFIDMERYVKTESVD